MKKLIAKKWVAALRSGKYDQAQGALHTVNGGFCCLGVLCDLYAKEKKIRNGWGVNTESPEVKEIFGENQVLPDQVKEWAGLNSDDGKLLAVKTITSSLAQENDNGSSFSKIADMIEEHVKDL